MQRKQFIAGTLSLLPVLSLAAKSTGSSKHPFVIKAGGSRFNEQFLFRGLSPNDIKISGKDTGGALCVFEYTGREKTGPSLHVHYKQDEIFCVINGQYRFVVGDETHLLKEGDTIFLPRNIPHTWIQLSDEGKLIYWLQPAGKMEDFFRLMNEQKQAPTKEEMDRIHREHDMKVVGPPLSL